MDGLLLGILSGLLRQTLFFLPGLMPDHALRYLSGHGHDDHGGDDSDRDHGQTDRFENRPGVQQAYGGGNEHDRHDLDQEIGGGAYLSVFVLAIVRMLQNRKESPILLAAAAAVLSYAGHNFFCYQQAVCTPLIFIVIGAAEYLSRNQKYAKP